MTESTAEPQCWWLYVVETAAGALYTGISTDVERRFREHRHGRRGARALRGKGPLRLVHCQRVGDHGDALRLEAWLKRQSAPAKRAWLATRGGEAASPPQSAAASAAKTRATASAPGSTTPSSDSGGT
ncbi:MULTISPECIES: GIY-YIG nuclease family protein [unclassified Modicisalibacter]|uniref:GIY-YIG nuclease family protein n=1 Tax=unclassified Modicisalibacter TaxID=2679913 RepID=UPI001CD00A67|nr:MULTISPECIES: GIY-YIG nuclease family protein [unclassified Modicisalibacter]MBZ9556495.1 GIY-YIG nuclease family protein [Modicisalibacter sp. R2A 31.J]MBZ9575036.1 GIY-YIG nuclease family protein [Modicisalibacter sp. MOD 31.J]